MLNFRILALFFSIPAAIIFCRPTWAAELPLLRLADIHYKGAFRLPAATYGGSSLNYSEGPLEYNPTHHSIFIVGHSHHQNIAEFAIPGLKNSTILQNLPMAAAPLQQFTPILNRATSGNPQKLDRIGGMRFFNSSRGPQLLINAYEYYDAPGDNSQTTLIARDSSELGSCTMDGYHSFQGGAGHTSGWISPIPQQWQNSLGGDSITGQSSGIPIISRTSVGPSAFTFFANDLIETTSITSPISTTKLLDFSLAHPLHEDLSNISGNNDIWTHLSRVVYGFIVPDTRTYLTIGHSGGHDSGVCYKCVQNNGNLCGGYCANDANDYSLYYWSWDIEDMLAVKNGTMLSHDVRPYDYGMFPTPFATRSFGGGSFDPGSGTLYLTIQKADLMQGTYSNPPVVVAFTFNSAADNTTVAPANFLLLK
ncbi:MAG: hypothetical protein V2I36_00340 [Desulfopila sp.]|jgi:hypothetical protein|nr:hypothetical protein [Desulfopila sp.]